MYMPHSMQAIVGGAQDPRDRAERASGRSCWRRASGCSTSSMARLEASSRLYLTFDSTDARKIVERIEMSSAEVDLNEFE